MSPDVPFVRVHRSDSRQMPEIDDNSVDLVVTSPPYWHIKDYGMPGQIGWDQSLHEYLYDLSRVWAECARTLRPGRRLCVNIGDQFARALIYGRYKIIPLHAEVIAQAQAVGLDYLGAIIWQKKTTMNTSGGAVVMGSFPYPPNGIVELDYEYILIFKKPGVGAKVSPERKSSSRLTTEEWKQYFCGHWTFGGVRQSNHEAMFPDELPRRLIRMFSFTGDTVLDPFLGSGTTAAVAESLGRNAIGYELNPDFLPLIAEKVTGEPLWLSRQITDSQALPPPVHYRPQTEDAMPLRDPNKFRFGAKETYKIREIVDEHTLRTDTGLAVSLLGVCVPKSQAARTLAYFDRYLRGKQVTLQFDAVSNPNLNLPDSAPLPAYVQLANKLFVNRKMIEMGLATADRAAYHKFRDRFIAAEEEAIRIGHEA
jgi:DNA modification methylase